MGRVTMRPEDRKEAIIDTAMRLFSERGIDATRMADISKAMGISGGLPYRYFASKLELVSAVATKIADEFVSALKEVEFADGLSASGRLDVLFDTFAGYAEQPDFYHDFHSETYAFIHHKIAVEALSQLLPLMTALIERGNEDGSFDCPDPRVAAAFILEGLSGTGESAPVMPGSGLDDTRRQMQTLRMFAGRLLGERR